MGGKRQANTLSALIQNFDTVEKVIETSANSAGSALKENERYLDSIQGKIDQFTNATQAMWNNFLDADTVKWVVSLGTEIIKIIGNLGLFKSALLAFGAYKGFKYLFSSFKDAGVTIKSVIQYVNSLTVGFKANAVAQTAANGATLASNVANKLFRNELVKTLATQYLTIKANKALELAEYQLALAKLGLRQGIASVADVQAAEAAVKAASVPVDITKIGTTELLGLAFKGLAASIVTATKAILTFLVTNPVGWVILATAAVVAAVAAWNKWGPTTENLTERLDELKSELSDIRSELDEVNQELKTTNDRMAELLAKDKLTFTEQEELEQLKKTNAELERRQELLEAEEKHKAEIAARQAARVVESNKSDKATWKKVASYLAGGAIPNQTILATFLGSKVFDDNSEDAQDNITKYQQLKDKYDNASSLKDKQKYQEKLDGLSEDIDKYILTLSDALEGVEYGDSDESDAALDYLAELRSKYSIARGDANAKTNAVAGVFAKDEFASIKDSIDGYVESLAEGDVNAEQKIRSIIENNTELSENLKASGVDIDDAIKYFTQLGSDVQYDTIEGKTQEIANAADRLPDIFYGAFSKDFTGPLTLAQQRFAGLFDEDGNVLTEKIAEYFHGTSEATRNEIARLVKNVHDGTMTVQQALNSFAAYGVVEGWKIIEAEVSDLNTNVFKDLGDDISGVIDTVKELGSAFESVASSIELVDQAQAEMANSGHLSVETALQLMESTDNWNELLEIENGNIKLVEGAEDALIQTKLDLIKTNLQTALSTVEAQLAQLDATSTNLDAATTIEESTNVAVRSLAGNMAYAAKMAEAYTRAMSGENINVQEFIDAAETARQNVIDATNYKSNAVANVSREELESEKERLETMLGVYNTVDSGSAFKSNYYSDKVSGGNSSSEEVADDAFEKLMDYYDNRISAYEARHEQIQNDIDFLESQGKIADKQYYIDQLDYLTRAEESKEALLNDKLQAAADRLKQLEAAGKKGSEEWWDAATIYNNTLSELDDIRDTVLDIQDAIGDIEVTKFEELNSRLDTLKDKLGTIRDLIAPNGEEDWFDDEGGWTEKGVAVLGSYVQDLELAKSGLNKANEALNAFGVTQNADGTWAEKGYVGNEKWYADNYGVHSEQEYYNYLQKLTDEQYKYAQSVSDTEQDISGMWESQVDAVEEYIDTMVDAYNDYIDSVKEALDAERDLYQFKKDIVKQTKDIAAIERRIASLSGSTNAADIAERRKLEAELYESRESLNDTYYDHSKQSQQDALDAESQAYEEVMTKFVENLRTNLELALQDMDTFIQGVTSAVTTNAPTILETYNNLGVALDQAIVDPWQAAIDAMGDGENGYSGSKGLGLMNSWIEEGGAFSTFATNATSYLTSIWSDTNVDPDNAFSNAVSAAVGNVVEDIRLNVVKAQGYLADLMRIKDSATNYNTGGGDVDSGDTYGNDELDKRTKEHHVTGTLKLFDRTFTYTAASFSEGQAKTKVDQELASQYYNHLKKQKRDDADIEKLWSRAKNQIKYKSSYYAKGTTGVPKNQLAIVDELGPELILHADPTTGRLQYLTKGSGVVPAALTENLMEWGQITPDALKLGGGVNINMINNAVNKPEFNFAFDALVKAERIDENTLPEVKRFVQQEINSLVKQMNYAIKGKGGR